MAGSGRPGDERAWRRMLAGAVGAALALASVTAGVAAIRMNVFPESAPLADAELDRLRGGFTLPTMPDVSVRFGFTFDASADLPGLPAPAFIAMPGADDRVRSRAITRVAFDDPREVAVSTSETVNGRLVRDEQRVVDLTREPVELQVGDPARAVVAHVLDAHQVTTLIQSVVADAHLRSDQEIAITLHGVPALQRKLPSAALVRSMDALQHALTTMSR
jgi:hypothetical protein